MHASFAYLIAAVIAAVIGLTLTMISILHSSNCWQLLCLCIYMVAPLPFFLCWKARRRNVWFHYVGLFVGGLLAAAGPALLIVLYHTGSILDGNILSLSLGSGLCIAISAGCLLIAMSPRRSDEDVEEDDLFA